MQLKGKMAFVLSVVMLFSCLSPTAFAESTTNIAIGEISPAYEIAQRLDNELTITMSTAECQSDGKGKANTVKISVVQTLEKYSGWFWIWNDVKDASWSKTANGDSVSIGSTKSGLESGTYRLRSVFTLTDKNGKSETITIYSFKFYCFRFIHNTRCR